MAPDTALAALELSLDFEDIDRDRNGVMMWLPNVSQLERHDAAWAVSCFMRHARAAIRQDEPSIHPEFL